MEYNDMSNNQLMTEIQSLMAEHEAIKIRIDKEIGSLEAAEKNFKKANDILASRIKGQTNNE